jgi:hypothetical protein
MAKSLRAMRKSARRYQSNFIFLILIAFGNGVEMRTPTVSCGSIVPKSTGFKAVSQAEVKRAVNKINSRPRKNLGFKNPGQLMD